MVLQFPVKKYFLQLHNIIYNSQSNNSRSNLSDKDIRIINQMNKIVFNSINKQKYTQNGGTIPKTTDPKTTDPETSVPKTSVPEIPITQSDAIDLTSDKPTTLKNLSDTVAGFKEINTNLKNLLDKVTGEINEDNPVNRKSTDINKEIIEIAQVAITLIKFLGELLKEKPDNKLIELQKEIAGITLSLEKYLE